MSLIRKEPSIHPELSCMNIDSHVQANNINIDEKPNNGSINLPQSQQQQQQNPNATTNKILAKLYNKYGKSIISIPYKNEIIIGRSSKCDIKISGIDTSSKHCKLILTKSEFSQKIYLKLIDLSSNGIWLNDEKINKLHYEILKSGDKLQFGKTGGCFIFKYEDDNENENEDEEISDLEQNHENNNSFFDDYILGKQLGSGHYAIVKEGKNKKTGENVAVKIFHPNKTNVPNSQYNNKLKQEMSLLLSINHPNIVKFIKHYIEPNKFGSFNTFLVLEKMNNGELFQRIITKTKLSPIETKAIFKQLLSGVKYLHDNNIIHRDIKPENILLDITPRSSPSEKQTGPWDYNEIDLKVKIADFGLAKFIGELNFTNTLCGTPAYVAPEILNNSNNRNYSKKVDLWSSGVLLYVCLCGFPPFSDELAPPNMKEQILTGKYAFYSPYFDEIDDIILDLITNLLQVDPNERFDIEQTLNHEWFKED
ncbi:DUN1 [Candida pseudojiufengensis]|uniref:DUN1 n=1 Tax=Candida pseudojiufengensis TaxID=497109 RepID=UPI0022247CBC|nr:DUN1 [Candida pseudojiufengensis]KAI5964213.1 DUN1 [Candida pseudojiufengensis]